MPASPLLIILRRSLFRNPVAMRFLQHDPRSSSREDPGRARTPDVAFIDVGVLRLASFRPGKKSPTES